MKDMYTVPSDGLLKLYYWYLVSTSSGPRTVSLYLNEQGDENSLGTFMYTTSFIQGAQQSSTSIDGYQISNPKVFILSSWGNVSSSGLYCSAIYVLVEEGDIIKGKCGNGTGTGTLHYTLYSFS